MGAAAVELTRFERDRVLAKPTENLAAYEYVLRGRDYFSHATRDENDDAQHMFQHAIDLDPNYATAYAELGLALIEAVTSGWTEFVADDLGRAETLAQKALSLDPASTTAYRLLAEVHMARGQFDLALGQVERALEINPSDAKSLALRGAILMWAGRAGEALPWVQGALRLDPTNARTAFYLGVTEYFLAQRRPGPGSRARRESGTQYSADGAVCFGGYLRTVTKAAGRRARASRGDANGAVFGRQAVRFTIRHAGSARPYARRANEGRISLIRAERLGARRGRGGIEVCDCFDLDHELGSRRQRDLVYAAGRR